MEMSFSDVYKEILIPDYIANWNEVACVLEDAVLSTEEAKTSVLGEIRRVRWDFFVKGCIIFFG